MTHSDQADCAVAEPTVSKAEFLSITPPMVLTSPNPGVRSRKSLFLGIAGALMVVGLGWGTWSWLIPAFLRSDDRFRDLPRMTVAKVDMSTVLTSWGRVESSNNTIISCELERLEIRAAGGRSMSSGGASTILTLIDEGKQVKTGDVLCTLDASEYEELVRTQEIKTEQAAAAQKQSQLNFEVAELSVEEYRKGLHDQRVQSMEGSIALAQSDVERAGDRLEWIRKMLGKGYASVATKSSTERDLNQSQQDLLTSLSELSNFREFGHNKTLMELSSEVEKRRFEVLANTMRVTRNRDQLAYYKKMVDNCTIRAPHDGFLIFAYDPWKPNSSAIEPGQTVRQAQKLFFLPDLGKMEVMTYIHESVASRVHEGMRAKARIEGLSNRTLEGHVVSVAPMPTNAGNWFSDEVKYFVGVVKLDSVPAGLRPGMSAEVEFDVDRVFDVLAVSSEAVAVENGHDICYVAGVDGLERRPVTLGRSNRDLLEVKKGLAEGDQVFLNPEKIGLIDSIAAQQSKDSGFDETPVDGSPVPSGTPVSVE